VFIYYRPRPRKVRSLGGGHLKFKTKEEKITMPEKPAQTGKNAPEKEDLRDHLLRRARESPH